MSETPSGTGAGTPRSSVASRRGLLIAVPLIVVMGLFGMFFVALEGADPQRLPSAMIGREVPAFELPPVPHDSGGAAFPAFRSTDLAAGEPSLVNIFASWCAPCIIEHPLLMDLGKSVPIYGINYKDKPDAARRFIGRHGNPYRAIGRDETGRTAIEFGVYGVPARTHRRVETIVRQKDSIPFPSLSSLRRPGPPRRGGSSSKTTRNGGKTKQAINQKSWLYLFRRAIRAPAILQTRAASAYTVIHRPMRSEATSAAGSTMSSPFCARRDAGRPPRFAVRTIGVI
jgi:cytochrome c biogenesis protein CcmG/thiol:disulfide interchange protein DsbE